jgi:hypothetical protein
MRTTYLATLAMPVLLSIGISTARAEEPTPAEPAPAEPETEVAAAAAAADTTKTDGEDALRLPLGFKPKKRGKFTVYCRKETVMGTRFPVETCYDENSIREYLAAQRENQEKVDQMRRICGSQAACGAN